MRNGTLSRRGFLRASLASMTIGAGLPGWFAHEVIAEDQAGADRRAKSVGPNGRIGLGSIGIGGQGYRVMTEAVGKRPDVALIAAADVDASHLRDAIAKSGYRDIAGYGDFRALLDRPDIDAVTVTTPDHWHVLIAVAALRAGKDVYCEKPMTLTIAEGQVLTRVARETGRVVQVGTQQRSDPRFRLACELVRNGRIGKVTGVETRIGSNPRHRTHSPTNVPDGLDWEMWLGQAPDTPYMAERCHYNFRWWYEYSGGKVTDWGAHHNDIAQWGLGTDDTGPVAVEAVSTRLGRSPYAYACPVDFTITYTYADGVTLVCSSKGKNGVMFIGEKGSIFVDRAKIDASDPRLLDEPLPPSALRLHSSTDHIRNFLDCVKTRETPVCDANIGHRSASVCHLGNIALRTRESLRWDPADERFLNSDEANLMLSREMRSPWRLEG